MKTITVELTDRQAAAVERSLVERSRAGWHSRASIDYERAVEKIADATSKALTGCDA